MNKWREPWFARQIWHLSAGHRAMGNTIFSSLKSIPLGLMISLKFSRDCVATLMLLSLPVAVFGGTAFGVFLLRPWLIIFPILGFVFYLVSWLVGVFTHHEHRHRYS